MGRPKKEIDGEKVKRLAGMGLTVEEIAAVMDCDKRTIERRFAAVIKVGRERRNGSLRRKQYALAMKGNAALLIFLGKQYLGQRDTVLIDDQFDPVSARATVESKLAELAAAGGAAAVPALPDGTGNP